jgi:hypothetical protein
LVAVLFQERGTVGVVFTVAFTVIAGSTLAAALEAISEHCRQDAADDRNTASLTLWQRVGAAISSRDIAALWLAWVAVVGLVIIGGWLLNAN